MEINDRERRRGGRRDRGLDDSEYSGGDTSTTGSESEKDERPGRSPRRWESPTVTFSQKEEEVRAFGFQPKRMGDPRKGTEIRETRDRRDK
jgi:hypothetical protein